jgi:uncharacterized protein DUF2806
MRHNDRMQERWLDKVWMVLFGESGGLIPPGQIRREGLERERVRAAELAAIVAAQRELVELRSGRKVLGRGGQVVDAVAVGDVPMYSFIEQPAADSDAISARLGNPERLLDSVISETAHRDLERSLNIRRIALLIEQEILAGYAPGALSETDIGSQWLQRWRQLAQDVNSDELQRLWARLLMREVAAPGRYSLATIDALGAIGEREVHGILLLSRYVFGEFIFDARGRYFQSESHELWLNNAAALGLLHPIDAPRFLNLHAQINEPSQANEPQQPLLLINHNRAIQLSAIDAAGVPLPVLRLTAVGKQLFSLCGGDADMAYLFDLAAYLTERGIKVALGEWQPLRRHFEKKFDYS